MKRNFGLLGLAPLAFLAAACGTDSTEPGDDTRPPGELTIVALAGNHPPFYNTEVSFWARPGEDSEGRIFFQDGNGERGEYFVRLRVRRASLRAFPDGRAFGPTDSVLITMRVPNPEQFQVELLPSGLTFDASEPAALKFEFVHSDRDLNDDGVVNGQDDALEQAFAIWRQEALAGPYVKLATIRFDSTRELQADLLGFSRFAIAY